MRLLLLSIILPMSLICLSSCGSSNSAEAMKTAAASGRSMFEMINQVRASEGLQPVRRDAKLDRVARDHSQYMASTGKLSHSGAGGTRYEDRMMKAGYSRKVSLLATECIAYTPSGRARVMRTWAESSGHRRNLLQKEHNRIGIAEVGGYWTVILANP